MFLTESLDLFLYSSTRYVLVNASHQVVSFHQTSYLQIKGTICTAFNPGGQPSNRKSRGFSGRLSLFQPLAFVL